jgi:hypothetical protein
MGRLLFVEVSLTTGESKCFPTVLPKLMNLTCQRVKSVRSSLQVNLVYCVICINYQYSARPDLIDCQSVIFLQVLCFWTLSIILSLSKNRPVYFSKYSVSVSAFYLLLQVKPTQLGPIDRANPYLRSI